MAFTTRIADDGEILRPRLTPPVVSGHKYERGNAVIISGLRHRTGSARIAARACLRTGAGLVTLVGKPDALDEHAAHVSSIPLRDEDNYYAMVGGQCDVVAIGPGCGVNDETCEKVLKLLARNIPVVLDADAMTAFEYEMDTLIDALHDKVILTPHEGEFARLFPDIDVSDHESAVLAAAERCHANVLLKGAETCIASPGGRLAVNRHASPWLATVGSGDVLTGIIAGVIAQGCPTFEGAATAAWLHGEIGCRHGPGLVSEDMPKMIPDILVDLLKESASES